MINSGGVPWATKDAICAATGLPAPGGRPATGSAERARRRTRGRPSGASFHLPSRGREVTGAVPRDPKGYRPGRPALLVTSWLTALTLLLIAPPARAQSPCGTYSVLDSHSAWQISTTAFNPTDYIGFNASYTAGDNCSVGFYRGEDLIAGYPLNASGGTQTTQSSAPYGMNDGQVEFSWEYVCGLGVQKQTCDTIARTVDVQHYIATIVEIPPVPIDDGQGTFSYVRFDGSVTGQCAPGNQGTVGFRVARRDDDGPWIGIPTEGAPATFGTPCGGVTSVSLGTTTAGLPPGPHAISFRVYPLQSSPSYPFPTATASPTSPPRPSAGIRRPSARRAPTTASATATSWR